MSASRRTVAPADGMAPSLNGQSPDRPPRLIPGLTPLPTAESDDDLSGMSAVETYASDLDASGGSPG